MTAIEHPSLPYTVSTLVRIDGRTWTALAPSLGKSIELLFPSGPVFVLDTSDDLHVLPGNEAQQRLTGSNACWVLPSSPTSTEPAWLVRGEGTIDVRLDGEGSHVVVQATIASLTAYHARPHADVDGSEFAVDLPGAKPLVDALAGFYWGTMLPCVVERTVAATYPESSGYVVSTLAEKYMGTYPDVDHEFQVKGRLAWGSRTDLHIARRMIELQLRLMREDPQQLWRDPCAVQPNGDREYHVRRSSLDGTANAAMFLVTGNVEVLESIWLYIARTKDLTWLRANIEDIEGAASWIVNCMDPLGRLWSDVYYEDQVIKDGRETMASALAANSFELLAQLEDLLGRGDRAAGYRERSDCLAGAIRASVPVGHWDDGNERFVDWVDRAGIVHDHVHLLANVLPAMFGLASAAQTERVLALIDREFNEFQRFPTFLATRIADYTDNEIGDGGPYDLCAAGRYWCWDAAFWSWRRDGGVLRDQLDRVAQQGAEDGYIMGERYDVDHIYYVDGSPWHGAAHYYEYPCVFSWVMINEFLGVRSSIDADLLIAPRIVGTGSVILGQSAYQLSYRFDGRAFFLENLAPSKRTFEIDLSAVFPDYRSLALEHDCREGHSATRGCVHAAVGTKATVEIRPGETIRLAPAEPTTAFFPAPPPSAPAR